MAISIAFWKRHWRMGWKINPVTNKPHNERVGEGIMIRKIFLMSSVCFALGLGTAHAEIGAVPSSAWLVGPASMSAAGAGGVAGIPCIVTNQFNNGYSFRFSGGGNRLLAVAIDIGQPTLTHGQDYDVEIDVPGEFFQLVSASAHDDHTLLLSLKNMPDVYDALKKARNVAIRVQDGPSAEFVLVGLSEGFKRMEACYNGGGETAPSAPAQRDAKAPLPAGVFEIKSTSGDKIVMPEAPVPAVDAPAPALPPVTAGAAVPPMAPMGEMGALTPMPGEPAGGVSGDVVSIEHLLDRAADDNARAYAEAAGILAKAKQGADTGKALAAKGIAPAPAAPVKEEAVKEVSSGHALAANWADPTVKRANPSDIVRGDVATRTAVGSSSATPSDQRWAAVKGQDLRSTIESWGAQQGLQVIWMADSPYTVQRSVNFQGPLTGALSRLLEQFGGEAERPVGRIYNDPTLNGQVLVVESDRAWKGQ
jgi:hypothetical protein